MYWLVDGTFKLYEMIRNDVFLFHIYLIPLPMGLEQNWFSRINLICIILLLSHWGMWIAFWFYNLLRQFCIWVAFSPTICSITWYGCLYICFIVLSCHLIEILDTLTICNVRIVYIYWWIVFATYVLSLDRLWYSQFCCHSFRFIISSI